MSPPRCNGKLFGKTIPVCKNPAFAEDPNTTPRATPLFSAPPPRIQPCLRFCNRRYCSRARHIKYKYLSNQKGPNNDSFYSSLLARVHAGGQQMNMTFLRTTNVSTRNRVSLLACRPRLRSRAVLDPYSHLAPGVTRSLQQSVESSSPLASVPSRKVFAQ